MSEREKKHLYFDIPKQDRDSAIAYLLESIVKSRETLQIPSNKHEFDEDVNIYLAHLLFAAALPDYQEAVRRYVSLKISDVTDLVDRAEDRVIRYFIYKVNADHLLIHLGMFNHLDHSHRLYGKTEIQYSSMAQNYYEQAAQYHKKIYRRETAIGSVLEKLSKSFPSYKEILKNVRKDFFHFSNEFHDQNFRKFCEDMKQYERETKINQMMDRFLELYSKWLVDKEENLLDQLKSTIVEMKKINPNFYFDLEEGEAA